MRSALGCRKSRGAALALSTLFAMGCGDGDGDRPVAATREQIQNRMPPLITERLRPAQIDAVTGLERSLREQRHDRSLIQMATGTPSMQEILRRLGAA